MDLNSVLNQAISPNPQIRNPALKALQQAFENPTAFTTLFGLLNDPKSLTHDKLVASIFLQNWIKDNYKLLDDQQLQQQLREQTFNVYFSLQQEAINNNVNQQSPLSFQVSKTLERMATCDFPQNTFIIENLPSNSEVSYMVLKSIVKSKLIIHRSKVEFLFDKLLNLKLDETFNSIKFSLQNQPHNKSVIDKFRIPLKLKLLESKVQQDKQSTILNYIVYLEFFLQLNKQQCDEQERDILMKIIYLIQKCMIRTMSVQKVKFMIDQILKVDENDCNYALLFVKKFYFQQEYQMSRTINIKNEQDLLEILKSSDGARIHQEKYLRLVLQIVRLINVILDTYSYNPLNISDDIEGNELIGQEGFCGSQILEHAFYEGYFEMTLQYLFNYAMQLSVVQLYFIYYQPEKSFTEEAEDSVAYDIRDSAQELLRTCFVNMKADYITELLIKQLQIFKQNPIALDHRNEMNPKQQYSQNLQFNQPPQEPNTLLACILQRETFYSTLAALFKLLKPDLDFEDWFQNHLYFELMSVNVLFLPLKLQILSLMNAYLSSSYQVPQDTLNIIKNCCFQLISGTEPISIKLSAIKCLGQLSENLEEEGVSSLSQIGAILPVLFNQCQQVDSKLVLMDFAVMLLKINALDFGWTLQTIIQEWNSSAQIQDEDTSTQNLTLRGKTLQVIIQLIRSCSSDVWFQAIEIFINMCVETLMPSDGLKEIYLTENGLSLFLHLLCQLSLQKNLNALNILQNLSKDQGELFCGKIINLQNSIQHIILNNLGLWNHCMLSLAYIIMLGLGGDNEMSQTLIDCAFKMYDEINLQGFTRYLFIVELYILSKAPKVDQTLSLIIPYLVNKINNQTQSAELIATFHLISVLNYTGSPLIEQFIYQSWFRTLLQLVYKAHINELMIQVHQMGMFFILCSRLMQNEAYLMSQLNIQQDDVLLSQIVVDLFDYLQGYLLKQLIAPQSYIGYAIREIISLNQDETTLRGLQTPDVKGVQDYKITYSIIKEEFLKVLPMLSNSESLQRIKQYL